MRKDKIALYDFFGKREALQFFSEYACVWTDNPELKWYEESFGALWHDLVGEDKYEDEDESIDLDVLLQIRAVCLVKIYLHFWTCFDEGDDSDIESMLYGVKVKFQDILNFIKKEKFNQKDYEKGEVDGVDLEDEDYEIIRPYESKLLSILEKENSYVYEILKRHYGGDSMLFVSLYNSRFDLFDRNDAEYILNDISYPESNQKLCAFDYVTDGLRWYA